MGLLPGVYVKAATAPQDPVERHLLMALAYQVRRPELVASHETAAIAHDLPLADASTVVVGEPRFVRPPGSNTRSTRSPQVTVREFHSRMVTEVLAGPAAGLRVTTAARTAVDLAAEVDLPFALMATDFVARRTLVSAQGLARRTGPLPARVLEIARRDLWEAIGRQPRHRRIRSVIEVTDPRRESPAESISAGRMLEARLPLPDLQQPIATALGLFYPDFSWPRWSVVGECDGRIKYDGTFGGDEGVLVAQTQRQRALEEAGFTVVRWLAAEMQFRPDGPIERITLALQRNGWDNQGGVSVSRRRNR